MLKRSKINYEVLRLITPAMLALIGGLLGILYNSINTQVSLAAADGHMAAVAISAIQQDIAGIKERLDRDETRNEHFGLRSNF